MPRHFKELDSVRGLAALSVVIYHFLLVFPLFESDTFHQSQFWLINIFKYSPVRVAYAGYEAVLLFFILSGFVLSLPFYLPRPVTYSSFLIKRICRIYLPYLGAVAVAVTLDTLFSRHGITTLSGWLNRTWKLTPAPDLVIKHIILIDSFDSNQYDPVLWSLVQEMRLSLIFPLLMLLINRYNWKFSLGVGLGVGIVGGRTFAVNGSYSEDIFLSLECVGLFIAGALLAKHRAALIEAYHKLSTWSHWLLFGGAILCYTAPWWLEAITQRYIVPPIGDIIAAIGCSIFIVLALASSRLSHLLLRKPLLFLGKISYSLYLYHVIFLLTAVNLLYGLVNSWLILLIAFGSTLALATLAFGAIEAPAMRLGKYLSTKSLQFTKPSRSHWHPQALQQATIEQIPIAPAVAGQGDPEESQSA